ncbi:hypothetical protein SDC9_40966 [bioreactor metagenome]|uniref:Uncharacterized protein n=1 Tax=bioreactor metagenome TaxID=1076179 RepID=A0A644VTW7_9ZZZZ
MVWAERSIEEVALRKRQAFRRLADKQLAIGAHLIGFRVHLDHRRRGVQLHVRLADAARALDRDHLLLEAKPAAHPLGHRRLGDEGGAACRQRLAEGAEHRPGIEGLRRDRAVRVAHLRRDDHAAHQHHLGLGAEEGRVPQHEVRTLADLDRADMSGDAMGDRRVDRVFRDVAADAEVVVGAGFLGQPPALLLHLVGGLPAADDDLAHTPHRLTVRADDRHRADVVQDILGGDRLLADPAFGEGHILGHLVVEVVAHHQHVEVFLDRVLGVGPRRVGRGRDHIRRRDHAQDVGGMAAARALGVEGVDGAALEGGKRVLDKAAFVQRVGVDHHLHVHRVGHRQAAVDRRGRGAPVLVQLERARPRLHHLLERLGQRGVALAGQRQVHREGLEALQHPADVPRPRGAGGGKRAMRGAGAAAEHRGHARGQRILDLLRADEVDMRIHAARGQDLALARDDLGARPDDQRDAGLGVGVAGLADAGDPARAQADVGLVDAGIVDDQRVGDDGVHRACGAADLALPHAVADHLAAAEFHLLAIGGEILLDLDDQIGIGQAQPVAGGGAEHVGIGGAGNRCGHQRSPITVWLKPNTLRAPR